MAQHKIWFNAKNQAYQLANIPQLESQIHINTKQNINDWKLIGSFEADSLVQIVSTFHEVSKAHRSIVDNPVN